MRGHHGSHHKRGSSDPGDTNSSADGRVQPSSLTRDSPARARIPFKIKKLILSTALKSNGYILFSSVQGPRRIQTKACGEKSISGENTQNTIVIKTNINKSTSAFLFKPVKQDAWLGPGPVGTVAAGRSAPRPHVSSRFRGSPTNPSPTREHVQGPWGQWRVSRGSTGSPGLSESQHGGPAPASRGSLGCRRPTPPGRVGLGPGDAPGAGRARGPTPGLPESVDSQEPVLCRLPFLASGGRPHSLKESSARGPG